MNKPPLIILTGPTAVGKTELSIALAKALSAEIISADSMQVYKHMDIGTAKIKSEQMQGIPHYLLDIFEPDEEFNITLFKELCTKHMKDIYSRGKIPMIVGGTGFYIQSILKDVAFEENENDKTYRHELEALAKEKGPDYVHNMLGEVDPVSAEAIHKNNIKRVIRALEFYKQTGYPISEHNERESKKESPYNFVYFVLDLPREILYERINTRVDAMMEEGLLDEVQKLVEKGYERTLPSMQGLGYKEFYPYFDGNISLEDVVNDIKQGTRHFAKRQGTWFRRETDVTMIHKNAFANDDEILKHMLAICKEKEILN